jgi:hypothetical protein
MKRTIWREAVTLATICCACLLGCQDPDLSIPIDSMTVYSLDGRNEWGRDPKPPPAKMFHEHPVLGKVDIASPKDRTAILAAIKKGIVKGGEGAKCFFPRHGVKFTQAGKTMEYVICFECSEFELYMDGVRSHEYTESTADTAHQILDEHLAGAGIPLQKPK